MREGEKGIPLHAGNNSNDTVQSESWRESHLWNTNDMSATFFYQPSLFTGDRYQVSFKNPTVFLYPPMAAIQLMFEKNGNDISNETVFIV